MFDRWYVFDYVVESFVGPDRVVVDDVEEVLWIFLFVSDWYAVVDFFRCYDEVVHDGDTDFVELERDGDHQSVRSNCFVCRIFCHDRTLDDFEGDGSWIKCKRITFIVDDMDGDSCAWYHANSTLR